MLDRTSQRIVGVLLEKELAVPDSYPMTRLALVAGCNQKSNREPPLELEDFEVAGAVMALQDSGWVFKIEGGRADRYRHDVTERLELDERERAVLAELLLRGPQAPGALKPRVARMGFHGSVDEILGLLAGMAERPTPLVERLPRQPRERDARWQHCLGELSQAEPTAPAAAAVQAASSPPPTPPPPTVTDAVAPWPSEVADLEARVAQLESELAALAEQVAELRGER